jgi:hypothetical protein
MEHRITLKNHLIALEILIFVVIAVSFYALFEFIQDNLNVDTATFLLLLTLAICIPAFYLHIEYYLFNKGVILDLNLIERKILISKKGNETILLFEEIEKIVIYLPPHYLSTNFFIRVPFDTYHYAIIFTKDGRKFIITNLLVNNLNVTLSGIRDIPIEKKKRIPAIINFR